MTDATSRRPPKPPRSQLARRLGPVPPHKGALFGLVVLGILLLFVVVGPFSGQEKPDTAEAIK
jgi:hypothetical protein